MQGCVNRRMLSYEALNPEIFGIWSLWSPWRHCPYAAAEGEHVYSFGEVAAIVPLPQASAHHASQQRRRSRGADCRLAARPPAAHPVPPGQGEKRMNELERRNAALEAKPAAHAIEHVRDETGAMIRSVVVETPVP